MLECAVLAAALDEEGNLLPPILAILYPWLLMPAMVEMAATGAAKAKAK